MESGKIHAKGSINIFELRNANRWRNYPIESNKRFVYSYHVHALVH